MGGFVDLVGGVASSIKDKISDWFLNPMQSLLAESPWWLAGLAIVALAFVFGGLRALVTTVVCLAGIWYLDLWHDAMITLNMALVGTVLVMILALVFGVWMARDRRVDLGIRPLLDAGQTIPPFVYLIPVLALFGPSRFTADRRGHRVRRPGSDQAGRGRRQGGVPDDHRGGPLDRPDHVAGDHQGPAADGQGVARAGHQPGPALRARHGRHRWPGRRRCARLRRRARHLPQRGVGQGRGRRPDHRPARRDARPDHPGRRRRTPRRRARVRAGPSMSVCRSARPSRSPPKSSRRQPGDEEKHHEDCQKPGGSTGGTRRRRHVGAVRLRRWVPSTRRPRPTRRRPPRPAASAAS